MRKSNFLSCFSVLAALFLFVTFSSSGFAQSNPFESPPTGAIGWKIVNPAIGHQDPLTGFFQLPVIQNTGVTWDLHACEENGPEIWHLHGFFNNHSDPMHACAHGQLEYVFETPSETPPETPPDNGKTIPTGMFFNAYSDSLFKLRWTAALWNIREGSIEEKPPTTTTAYFQFGTFDEEAWTFRDSILCAPNSEGELAPVGAKLQVLNRNPESFFFWAGARVGDRPPKKLGLRATSFGRINGTFNDSGQIIESDLRTFSGSSIKRLFGEKGDPEGLTRVDRFSASGGLIDPSSLNEATKDELELRCDLKFRFD